MADSLPNSARPSATDATSRTEWLLLALLSAIGLVLRVVPLSGLAIEHFDEGVYASNLLFPDGGYSYPARHLYAPPLLPNLIEWSIILGGNARWVPLLPGILLGTASIPVVWWLSRRWFDAPAAMAGACLLALSDFHIAFSRSALTDVPLVFFLMLAVGWLHRGLSEEEDGGSRFEARSNGLVPIGLAPMVSCLVATDASNGSRSHEAEDHRDEPDGDCVSSTRGASQRVSFGYCVLGGVAAGLAWATKYNGWLALAIGVSGTTAAGLIARLCCREQLPLPTTTSATTTTTNPRDAGNAPQPAAHPIALRICLGLAVTILTAAAVWSPVLIGLQDQGGYGAVAKNHRQYVHSGAEWLPAFRRHQAVQKHFAGPVTLLGVLLAPFLATAVIRAARSTGNEKGDSVSSAAKANGADRSPWNAGASSNADSGAAPLINSAPSTVDSPATQRIPTLGVVLMTAWLTSALVLDPVVVLVLWPLTDWGSRVLEHRSRERPADWSQWLGLWMSLAWIIGLLLATPFYRPYPRLLLPLCIAGYIGVGSAIIRLLTGKLAVRNLSSKWPLRRRLTLLVGLMVLSLSLSQSYRKGFVGGRPRNELAAVANKVLTAIRADNKDGPSIEGIRQLVYVYAEPGLFFHLTADDCLVGPVTDLSFARPSPQRNNKLPVYVVAGPHAFVSETFRRQYKEVRDSLSPVSAPSYRPSDFVLLDDVSPDELQEARKQRVQVFRVR